MTSLCLSFYSISKVSASSDALLNTLYITGYSSIDTENPRVLHMIQGFCTSVLSVGPVSYDGVKYDARYSAFVYLLCKNIWSARDSLLSDIYFVHTGYAELGFVDIQNDRDLCAPQSMSNDCNVHRNVAKLFNDIINDYTNINQFNLYGWTNKFDDDAQLVILADQYAMKYFGLPICETPDGRSYPKTCNLVKSFLKQTKNILSDVTILSASGILTTVPTTGDDNLFLNGLKWSMDTFVNLAYNELFYYRLFVWYYGLLLKKYPTLTSSSSVEKYLSSEYSRSKSALSLTLRMMSDTYVAFPFHVGLSMYQEDLDGIAGQFARLAPPIYTLYDKLRNVQTPQ